jgi:hypothetical protein
MFSYCYVIYSYRYVFFYYVMCYFVSLSILIVMCLLIVIAICSFFVFCLTMFCVLFVCKCVLYAATGCQPSCSYIYHVTPCGLVDEYQFLVEIAAFLCRRPLYLYNTLRLEDPAPVYLIFLWLICGT